MNFKKWDIVLVRFPFTDLSSTKKRPGLIISPNNYNLGEDIIIAFITSKLDRPSQMGDHIIKNWKESNLPKPSMIRMKFATIDKSIVDKKLGKLEKSEIDMFHKKLLDFFSK